MLLKGSNVIQQILAEELDEEIRDLVINLNEVHGLTTISSCFGHGKAPVRIWMKFNSIICLNRFMWAGCFRYFPISKSNWKVIVDDRDPNGRNYESIEVILESKTKGDDALKEINRLNSGLLSYIKDQTIVPLVYKQEELSELYITMLLATGAIEVFSDHASTESDKEMMKIIVCKMKERYPDAILDMFTNHIYLMDHPRYKVKHDKL